MELSLLKQNYVILAQKHKLPSFNELNERFEIERIERESECLLRAVRKCMIDKVANMLAFFEMLLHPVNAPRIYLVFIRQMSAEDTQLLEQLYNELGRLSLNALQLEVAYDEQREAESIADVYSTWKRLQPSLNTLMKKIAQPMQSLSAQKKKERTYLG